MSILDEAQEIKDYIVTLRRHFHKNPELSFKEFNTVKKIEEELTKDGIEYEKVGETGILAVINGANPGKTILLRADIDALPIQEANDVPYKSVNAGVMHACGHDAHAAGLLGAAKILASHKNDFNGKILLCFQPAEEIGNGVNQFIQNGKLKNVDRTFGIHMASRLKVGTVGIKIGEANASCDYFKITINGKTAHASKPHLGIDALYIASLIVVQMQSIVSRLVDPEYSAVVAIGKMTAGTAYNIVAGEAVIEGTTRAFSVKMREDVNSGVKRIAESVAKTYGAEVSIEFVDYAMPVVNDEKISHEVADSAFKVVGKDNVLTNIDKSFGADNFANLANEAPGVYALIGTQGGKSTAWAHHNEHFDIDEQALVYTAALHAQYALDYLNK